MPQNIERVNRGFMILRPWLAGYIGQEMHKEYGDDWWKEVRVVLNDQIRDLQAFGEYSELVDSLDIANCLRLFDRQWNDIFRKKLSLDYRTWAKELMGIRNKVAHFTGKDFDDDYAWRALDTMSRLCEAFDDEAAEEIRGLARELRYGSAAGSVVGQAIVGKAVVGGEEAERPKESAGIPRGSLPSWRTIMEPHPDVAQGRYKNAEFAANLAQVAKGSGPFEYRDPVEFFSRTYITEGMKGLLVEALKRVSGQDGEPVIQLKTAFGGGKTHSMLALYHLMRKKVPAEKLAGVTQVLEEAGVSEIPDVHVAVLVGTALNPTKVRRPVHMPGITIHTLWGEMAAQLAQSAGRPELYDYVKEADKKGVSPGHEALRQLFDDCGTCLILIDELVAYARKLYGISGLPAGTYDNLMSFVQEITEAASTSKTSLVVASIPESDIETGGEAGKIALEAIEHTFGRMEAVWKPVAASEGFEVVRRRLFLDCRDPAARDAVCERFSQMYQDNPGDFPVYAREVEYRDRMISCYPIHPEIFDHLYQEWSTMERFQRTRGVLRLMAAVIHELWMNQDPSPMILPGSLPLDVPVVRDELTRYLPQEWNGIVDTEVDGKKSIPYQKDQGNARYGSLMASRRLTRTIFLGSAPSDRSQAVRGIETARIRLGTVQPEENIAVFNDALNTLRGSLSYLYASPGGDHFWFDIRPTLRKTMEDRASQLSESDVEYEIECRLKQWRKAAPFAGLHSCPSSSLDVPDEKSVRLVVLGPKSTYIPNDEDCEAITECENILNHRGQSPRIYRNMLLFLAPDHHTLPALTQAVRHYRAWQSICDEREALNLDAIQTKEAEESLSSSDQTVNDRLNETYCWLLSPYMDLEVDNRTIFWSDDNIRGGDEAVIRKVTQRLKSNEALITQWAPALLEMKLDELLWRESNEIQIKTLWEDFCTYCYLPRLSSFSVLEECIKAGINSVEYFAYAEGICEGRYQGLKYDTVPANISEYGYLVKLPIAMKQILDDQKKGEEDKTLSDDDSLKESDRGSSDRASEGEKSGNGSESSWRPTPPEPQPGPAPSPKPKNTHFFLSTPLDGTRINKEVNLLVTEVINQLSSVDGAKVNITLEVDADLPEGTPTVIERSVRENCRTLKVEEFEFSD